MEENIIEEWLRSLHLGQYSESFIDNGYDDLEICKQVGEPDLDAIGVFNQNHRSRILEAVKILREEGGASVYFTLEETTQYGHDSCNCDRTTHSVRYKNSRTSKNGHSIKSSPSNSGDSGSSFRERRRFVDECEDTRKELIKIPKVQLRKVLKDKLSLDGIRLGCPPYTNLDGTSGYLDGLASRYADEFRTHYQDVIEHLEEIRGREWEELAARLRASASSSSHTPSPSLPTTPSSPCRHLPGAHFVSQCQKSMYVPGKYSPSSCLSDREEDEIYGWGYGLYGRHILKQQQARRIFSPSKCAAASGASVYENSFASGARVDSSNGGKKKVASSFVNMLKTLKVHRKPKNSPCKQQVNNLAADPLITPAGPNLIYPTSSHQWNSVVNKISIEEALLKLKEPDKANTLNQRKADKEKIFNDLREKLSKDSPETKPTSVFYTQDSGASYMFGDGVHPTVSHWYDDPPYESDPDDYLIQSIGVPTSPDGLDKGCGYPFDSKIISRDSIGKVSLPSQTMWSRSLEQVNVPPSQEDKYKTSLAKYGNPRRLGAFFRFGRNSVVGSHYGSSVPILNPKIKGGRAYSNPDSKDSYVFKEEFLDNSTVIVDDEGMRISSPLTVITAHTVSEPRNPSTNNTPISRRAHSVEHVNVSGDEMEGSPDRKADLMLTRGTRSSTLVGRMRGLGKDFHKRISRLKSYRLSNGSDTNGDLEVGDSHRSNSSAESLPSGSSSTQPLVASGSNRSSLSTEELDQSYIGPFIARARALVDCVPSPYDRDALKFQKDDIINVISMNQSGIWRGVAKNRVGTFKFINVELIPDEKNESKGKGASCRDMDQSTSVETLLRHLNLEHHISVFVLNGYETIQSLMNIEEEDLEYLGISDPHERNTILNIPDHLNDSRVIRKNEYKLNSRNQIFSGPVSNKQLSHQPSVPVKNCSLEPPIVRTVGCLAMRSPRRSLGSEVPGLSSTNSSGRSSESGYSTTSSHLDNTTTVPSSGVTS